MPKWRRCSHAGRSPRWSCLPSVSYVDGVAARPRLRRPPAARGWGGLHLLVAVLWAGLAVGLVVWWLDTPTGSINNRAELFIQAGRVVGLIAGYVLLVEIALRSRVGLLERWVG